VENLRVRFAPSPTGKLHIGNARTAMFNYLLAKKYNGKFVLRVEDTDFERSTKESENSILQDLHWLGLEWDEGPDKGGEYGPYRQSDRTEIYKRYCDELLEKEMAYRCFCTKNRISAMREEQKKNGTSPGYDGCCRNLEKAQIESDLAKGIPFVVRLKMPSEGETIVNDLLRGEVRSKNKLIDDQILLKSDGFPTYHLANVIDDHEMGITHVIRAEEWLPSTPKHILLYQMFNWDLPEFAHIPLILAPDKSKLSKRHGATGVLEYKKLGYLPEALINYLALLGWNPGDSQEIFTLEELENKFSSEKVHKAGAIFDQEKLDWINGCYIRKLSLANFAERCIPYLIEANLIDPESYDEKYVQAVVALEQERIKKLSVISKVTEYFFKEISYNKELLKWKKSDLTTAKSRLEFIYRELEKIPKENWTRHSLEQLLVDLIKAKDLGVGDTLWPMRTALTGQKNSPGPFEVAEVLGKEKTLTRIKQAIEKI